MHTAVELRQPAKITLLLMLTPELNRHTSLKWLLRTCILCKYTYD